MVLLEEKEVCPQHCELVFSEQAPPAVSWAQRLGLHLDRGALFLDVEDGIIIWLVLLGGD